jgi:hypothetical protein
MNHTRTCRYHTCEYHIYTHTCKNYSRVRGKRTLRIKSHSAFGNLTVPVEINLVRIKITLVRVVITFVRVVIKLMSVTITLIRVKITLIRVKITLRV